MWTILKTKVAVPTFLYSKSTVINEQELILGFEDEEGKKITIKFSCFLSNRETYEGALEKTLYNLYSSSASEVWKKSNMFVSENSEYLNWFKALNYHKGEQIKHYIIVAYDAISEVISTNPPIIKIKD